MAEVAVLDEYRKPSPQVEKMIGKNFCKNELAKVYSFTKRECCNKEESFEIDEEDRKFANEVYDAILSVSANSAKGKRLASSETRNKILESYYKTLVYDRKSNFFLKDSTVIKHFYKECNKHLKRLEVDAKGRRIIRKTYFKNGLSSMYKISELLWVMWIG